MSDNQDKEIIKETPLSMDAVADARLNKLSWRERYRLLKMSLMAHQSTALVPFTLTKRQESIVSSLATELFFNSLNNTNLPILAYNKSPYREMHNAADRKLNSLLGFIDCYYCVEDKAFTIRIAKTHEAVYTRELKGIPFNKHEI